MKELLKTWEKARDYFMHHAMAAKYGNSRDAIYHSKLAFLWDEQIKISRKKYIEAYLKQI